MTLRLPRAALRVLPLLVVLAVSAACTLQVGGGGKPSALLGYVGANQLLADPAATAPRPSLDVTLNRLWAARLVDVPSARTPSAAVVAVALKETTGLEHEDLRLRWATMQGDRTTAAAALAELGTLCGARAKDADPDCGATLSSVWAFLTATRAPVLPAFRATFPAVTAPACPTGRNTLSDLYLTALCGGPAVDEPTLERALSEVPRDGALLRDSRSLFVAAVVDSTFDLRSTTLRGLVTSAIAQSQVEGVYFDEVPAQGTVLTTWALLHLAGSDRSGLDATAVARAVRQEPTDGADDRVMLARAALATLGAADRPARGGALVLRDPDGPYNPFIALAARDAGDLDLVSLGFSGAQARSTPARFASYLITQRIISGRTATLSDADLHLLDGLGEPAPGGQAVGLVVPTMLRQTALAAAGRTRAAEPAALGCEGTTWLVEVNGICDLRASLLRNLYREFARGSHPDPPAAALVDDSTSGAPDDTTTQGAR